MSGRWVSGLRDYPFEAATLPAPFAFTASELTRMHKEQKQDQTRKQKQIDLSIRCQISKIRPQERRP